MKTSIDKIDKYLWAQDKKDLIYLSHNINKIGLDEAIDIYKKSDNKEHVFSMFNENIKKEIKKLIEGDII